MAIKKAYQEIINFLIENKNSKVNTVLPAVIELVSAKTGGGGSAHSNNVLRNDKGEVVAIFCYYHKMFEPVADVSFGVKRTSASGLSTMCKEGTSNWTKQQRAAKKANEALLSQIEAGKIEVSTLSELREAIAVERAVVIPREDKIGFATAEEALN